MAQFLADIAGMLEVFAIAAGLVLLHRARKDGGGKLLQAAAWVLVAGGLAVGACTTYYWFSYQSAGYFDATDARRPGMMRRGGMGPGRTWHDERHPMHGMVECPPDEEG